MNRTIYSALTPQQQHTLLLSMQVRNAMEDFNVKHLSDAQMAELNPNIRQGIFDAVSMIEDDTHPTFEDRMTYLISVVPDYWEIPEQPSRGRSGAND